MPGNSKPRKPKHKRHAPNLQVIKKNPRITEVPDQPALQYDALLEDIFFGKVFTSAFLPNNNLLPKVFLPLAVDGFSDWSDEALEQLGVIYEYYEKRGPLKTAEGFPVFKSYRTLNKKQWATMKDVLAERWTKAATARREHVNKTGERIDEAVAQMEPASLDEYRKAKEAHDASSGPNQ